MMNGILRIQTYRPRQSAPVEGVTVVITGSGFTAHRITDAEGNAEDVAICAPACALSLDENNTTTLPYAVCSLTARKPGYRTVRIQGIQIFAGQVTLARPEMIPDTEEGKDIVNPPVIIPTHALFAGNGGSGPAPTDPCTGSRVLDRVIVPKNITVHLGRPAASARNVTVSFRDYIANVASSEVYPTWPIEALKANIHCQISLALNRIYTEWYPSKGYTFNITNSTSYDQYYVHGRTVFDVMVKLTDDIFNTYIRKTGTVNPYYSEYCDGKSVTCPGLKQWGTVTLANQGRNALSILKYYYGSDIEIVRTSNIQSIPRSYPGSPLRQGDRGTAVFTLQRQLNRITKDYPFLGLLTVDGIFGSRMTETVKRFQKQFNLTADGVVGRQTWYKISYIYVSVKRPCRADQRGRNDHRNPLGRHLGRHHPARRLFRQRCGAAAVLVEHPGPVREQHPLRDSGWRVRQRHRRCGPGLPAKIRPVCGRCGGPRHLDRTLRSVPQHPVRQRQAQRLPGHGPAAGQQRAERPAGAVLAQDRPHGVSQPEHPDRRWEIRRRHGGGSAEIPELLRPDQ